MEFIKGLDYMLNHNAREWATIMSCRILNAPVYKRRYEEVIKLASKKTKLKLSELLQEII